MTGGSSVHAVMLGVPWRVAVFAGASAIIAAGLLTAWRGARWPVMSGPRTSVRLCVGQAAGQTAGRARAPVPERAARVLVLARVPRSSQPVGLDQPAATIPPQPGDDPAATGRTVHAADGPAAESARGPGAGERGRGINGTLGPNGVHGPDGAARVPQCFRRTADRPARRARARGHRARAALPGPGLPPGDRGRQCGRHHCRAHRTIGRCRRARPDDAGLGRPPPPPPAGRAARPGYARGSAPDTGRLPARPEHAPARPAGRAPTDASAAPSARGCSSRASCPSPSPLPVTPQPSHNARSPLPHLQIGRLTVSRMSRRTGRRTAWQNSRASSIVRSLTLTPPLGGPGPRPRDPPHPGRIRPAVHPRRARRPGARPGTGCRPRWARPTRPGSGRAVDVHVAQLRAKLAASAVTAAIRTVRGVGYILDDPVGGAHTPANRGVPATAPLHPASIGCAPLTDPEGLRTA